MTTDNDTGAIARRALITGAAVLGAAATASVAGASSASAADGDNLRLGRVNEARRSTSMNTSTWFAVRSTGSSAIIANAEDQVGSAAALEGRGNKRGVKGTASEAGGQGVVGAAESTGGIGVRGTGEGIGVDGRGSTGVYGESARQGGKGVHGRATQEAGAASYGVYGESATLAGGVGVYGKGPAVDPDLQFLASSFGVYADGGIGSSGPAFLGVPEYGATASTDPRLQESTMTFSADFSTPSPKLLVYVKNTDGVTYKAELPLTRV